MRTRGRIHALRGGPIPAPLFDHDLTGASVPGAFTFTRPGVRTFFGADGLVQTAAADVWPLEYDPHTLQPVGRPIWPQLTNLLLQSDNIGASPQWSMLGQTRDSGTTITSPRGQAARMHRETATTERHRIRYNNASVEAGVTYTMSICCYPVGRSFVSQNWADNVGGLLSDERFDLETLTTFRGRGGIQRLASGWFRVYYTEALILTGLANVELLNYNTTRFADVVQSYLGDTAFGLHLSDAQLVAGPHPGPIITTTSSQVTHSADSAQLTLSEPSDVLIQSRAGGRWVHAAPAGAWSVPAAPTMPHVARVRAWPAGQLTTAQKARLAAAPAT